MQGRGVMIDLEAHFGRSRQIVGYDELMEVMRRTTSWSSRATSSVPHRLRRDAAGDEQAARPEKLIGQSCAVLDGRDPRLQQWVTDSGAVALISDNYRGRGACRRAPAWDDRLRHAAAARALPVQAGLSIWARCCYLTELADWLRANGRSRFLFTGAAAAPARRGRLAGHAVATV